VPQRHEHLIQVVLVDDPVLLLVEKSQRLASRSSASFFLAKRSRAWLYDCQGRARSLCDEAASCGAGWCGYARPLNGNSGVPAEWLCYGMHGLEHGTSLALGMCRLLVLARGRVLQLNRTQLSFCCDRWDRQRFVYSLTSLDVRELAQFRCRVRHLHMHVSLSTCVIIDSDGLQPEPVEPATAKLAARQLVSLLVHVCDVVSCG
jgi:hypothetical protein